MSIEHPLVAILRDAATGSFPPADGQTEVLAPDADGTWAVVALTGHAYVLATVEAADVSARMADGAGGGFGGALDPSVLSWLAGSSGEVGTVDVVLAAAPSRRSTPGGALDRRHDLVDHPRVARSLARRASVQVYGDERGVVTAGRGLVGRWELSLELFDPDQPSGGAGRRLITAGRALGPTDEPCWAQVAAGNARSLRAFLAAGFVPIGSEVVIRPGGRE